MDWDNTCNDGLFSAQYLTISIGVKDNSDGEIFALLIHELMEIISEEVCARFSRRDCVDYVFTYNHKQHTTITSMLAGLLEQFIC